MSREDPWVCPICSKGPCVCTSAWSSLRLATALLVALVRGWLRGEIDSHNCAEVTA